MRQTFITAFFILFTTLSFSQTLRTTSLNLNVGGVIHDVEYIQPLNVFAVVGKFDSIGGFARKNLAFIRASNFTVVNTGTNFNPITSVSGNDNEFRAVEFLTIGAKEVLMIGGAFDDVNGQVKSCLLAMTRSVGAPLTQFFSPTLFDYDLQLGSPVPLSNCENNPPFVFGCRRGVTDMKVKGDTLLIVGAFLQITLSSNSVDEDSFIALKADPTAANISHFTHINSTNFCAEGFSIVGACTATHNYASALLTIGNDILIGSENLPYLSRLNNSFIQNLGIKLQDNTGGPSSKGYIQRIESLDNINDSMGLILAYNDIGTANDFQTTYIFKTNTPVPISTSAVYSTVAPPNNFIAPIEFQDTRGNESYNGDVFVYKYSPANPNTLKRFSINASTGFLTTNQVGSTININTASSTQLDFTDNLLEENGYLFISEKTMTSASGSARKGLAVYCLEPEHPKPFIITTPSVCAGDDATYSFYGVKNCDGYMYNFTGANVQYTFDNGLNWFAATPNFIVNSSTTSLITLKIRFLNSATSGTLTITPFSTCNFGTDYLFANSLTQAISVHPKPDLNLVSMLTQFDCNNETINLVAQSAFTYLNYVWTYNSADQFVNNDSLTIGSTGFSAATYDEGWYYVQATETDFGCSRKDSLLISEDFSLPSIHLDSLNSNPEVWNCATTSASLSANIPNCSVYWTTILDTSVHFTNPHTVFSSSPNNFTLFAKSNLNGCKAQQNYGFTVDVSTLVSAYLPQYSPLANVIHFDTLNCFQDSISVLCAIFPLDPNAAFGTIEWLLNGNDSLLITLSDALLAVGDLRTFKYVTTNLNNFCKDTSEFVVYFDFLQPFVGTTIGGTTLNCSRDTVELIHQQTGGQVTEGWLDSLNLQTGLPNITADTISSFYYEVTSNLNGCKNRDTVSVIRTYELLLSGVNDTLVCPNIPLTLSVSPVNNTETITYLWSTGSTINSTNAIGGFDTISVQATTPSGCIGTDSIFISITDPISATIDAFAGCRALGSLQVSNASGGAGGYSYAIESSAFSASPLFDSLALGNYTISILDILGCVYDFPTELNSSAQGPSLEFLVSTYSGKGDTLVFVNTTTFAGYDSVSWSFPAGVTVLYSSDSVAFVQFADTGWYSVTLTGFLDSCSYSFTKIFHVNDSTPIYESVGQQLGILQVDVFPNPSTGTFQVDVLFAIKQDYSIFVVNNLSQPVPTMQATGKAINPSESFSFPASAVSGTYRLIITSTYDTRSIQIVFAP